MKLADLISALASDLAEYGNLPVTISGKEEYLYGHVPEVEISERKVVVDDDGNYLSIHIG